MEELFDYLQSVYPISDTLQFHLRNLIKEKRLFRNELLLKSGNVCRHIYFVRKGLLRGFYMKDDEEVSTWFMQEGDLVISVSSFYTQQPGDESIQALEETLLWYLPYDDLQVAYNRFPELNFVGRVITEKYYMLCENRIKSIRMLKAPERHDQLLKNHGDLMRRVPAKYLSSYLGVTKVTFSRSQFKKK